MVIGPVGYPELFLIVLIMVFGIFFFLAFLKGVLKMILFPKRHGIQKVVREEEVESYIENGWRYLRDLGDKVIIEK